MLGVASAFVLLIVALNSLMTERAFSSPPTQISSLSTPSDERGDPALDNLTILKPGEATDFVPTPFTPAPMPTGVVPLTPGQPWVRDFRASPENLTKIPPTPTVDAKEPWVSYAQIDVMPSDSKQVALVSELVVLAHVTQVHPSRWSTSDGKRPTNPHSKESRHEIYTQTDVEIKEILSGEANLGDTLRLLQNGGQIGEDKLVFVDGYAAFTEGDILLLYLDSFVYPGTQELFYRVNERYFINASDQIASNQFEERSVDILREEIQEANQMKQAIREGRFTPPSPEN